MPERGPDTTQDPADGHIPGPGDAPLPSPRHPSAARDRITERAPAATPAARARTTSLLVTLVLGGLSAVPPLSMDLYLPALPQVTDSLSTSAANVQLTLTSCLVGLALGQLVIGPLSDRWGRRPPLLTGLVVFVIATAACALAPSAATLTVFRLVQGLAGAAGVVIARAVVRDLYDGVEMARFFSTLMLIAGTAPIAAPLIGSGVLQFTDWRGVFALLTAVGLGITVLAWRVLPETLPPERRHSGGLGKALRLMRELLADRVFTGYMFCGGFAFGAAFTYISASPFVLQEIYGASPETFSLLFGLNSAGMIAMSQLNGKLLVGRVNLDKVLTWGLGISLCAIVLLLLNVAEILGTANLVSVSALLFVMFSVMGLALPNTNALALMRTPHAAGTASALLGTSVFLLGAVISPLASVAGEDTALPMTLVQFGCVLASLGCFLGLCRPWQHPAKEVAS
ncbi:multidrug effflux MFS transporter [Streptomyces sp. NA04227]|uniref:multidrug effflux MFS transporter n=1 Tax=Streptomyces sp. NA04227 TaxID=2742136 RepID=UPI001591CC72|nr:multidrug effflux MFS transporter [Streptomyces sp. NA04227]QKW06152.1 multidrug effflux MFS transporter [Streptomyces sp. NA04227]